MMPRCCIAVEIEDCETLGDHVALGREDHQGSVIYGCTYDVDCGLEACMPATPWWRLHFPLCRTMKLAVALLALVVVAALAQTAPDLHVACDDVTAASGDPGIATARSPPARKWKPKCECRKSTPLPLSFSTHQCHVAQRRRMRPTSSKHTTPP